MAQLVAHHTGSVGVTGSNPVSSTGFQPPVFTDRGFCWLSKEKCVFSGRVAVI